MNQKNDVFFRRKKRYNHVQINLMIKSGKQWKRIKAADWNAIGFNFIFTRDLTERSIIFKKGHIEFIGEIVWIHRQADEMFLMEMALNTLIINHLKQLAPDRERARRMLKLIRSPGQLEIKREVLRIIDDFPAAEEKLKELIRKEKPDYPYFRYGVKVDSPEWMEIVRYTLAASDVVLQLGRLGEGFTLLSD